MPSEPCGRGSISLPRLRGSRRTPRNHSRFASASRPAWWWSATSAARVRCGSTLWSGRRRTLQPAFRPWPSPGRSSSLPPRAGCSAICFVCATSAGTRSRVLPSRSRRGWWRAYPIPRAASRRSVRRGRPVSSAARTRLRSCWSANRWARKGEGRTCWSPARRGTARPPPTPAAVLVQFGVLGRRQPILLSFEDAQWADATSLELLDLTVERVRQLPVLALFTFRPEFEPPWAGLPNVGTLTLGRLDRDDVENMVARVTGGRVLPAEVMKQIVAKTDGNPLFVEELTKAVLEAGILVENHHGYRLDGQLATRAIPETLRNSIMARLDRPAPGKGIGQIGATIRRRFSYS